MWYATDVDMKEKILKVHVITGKGEVITHMRESDLGKYIAWYDTCTNVKVRLIVIEEN